MSILPSTPQTQGDDCGVLAAAYATELVAGDSVAGLQAPFDVPAMRPHLERCLGGRDGFVFEDDKGRAWTSS